MLPIHLKEKPEINYECKSKKRSVLQVVLSLPVPN